MEARTASQILGGNPGGRRSEVDFYPTPPEVTEALLRAIGLRNRVVWEPACGEGDMAEVIRKHGNHVIATDIQKGQDFLTMPFQQCDWIITNPPFSLAEQFIRKAAEHEVPFAMLLKSQYWHAAKRVSLFLDIPPSHVLPLAWRPDFLFKKREKGSPLMDVIWCIWIPGASQTVYFPLERPTFVTSCD